MGMYYDYETKNESFITVHKQLESKNIEKSKFMLALVDISLKGVDPYDLKLNYETKQRVLKECMYNYWYFIRECIRIPIDDFNYKPYNLYEEKLRLHFAMHNNYNIIVDFKADETICIRLLWELLFSTESRIILIDKCHALSKSNLEFIRKLRASLPQYLKLDDIYNSNGGKIKSVDNQECIENPYNNTKITTKPIPSRKEHATHLGRGLSCSRLWYNDFSEIPFADIIYTSSLPVFYETYMNAKRKGNSCGIIITANFNIEINDRNLDVYSRVNMIKEQAVEFEDYLMYDLTNAARKTFIEKYSFNRFIYIHK